MSSPTFQPRFGEDTYPIGRFILERSRALGISRSDLVHRLGYRDICSGHKALSEVLLTGSVSLQRARHLADALELDGALIGFMNTSIPIIGSAYDTRQISRETP